MGGEKGPQGPQGDIGERGPPGEPATRGGDAEQGPVGFPGERGECGDAGQPGPPGDLLLRIGHITDLQTPENLEANIREIVKEWLADENNRESILCIDPDCEPVSQFKEAP